MRFLAVLAAIGVFACKGSSSRVPEDRVYTLYRSSTVTDERLHMATFDAAQSDLFYNLTNCEASRRVEQEEQHQRGTVIKFWCEKGYYRE
jgi:hypothetical protein